MQRHGTYSPDSRHHYAGERRGVMSARVGASIDHIAASLRARG